MALVADIIQVLKDLNIPVAQPSFTQKSVAEKSVVATVLDAGNALVPLPAPQQVYVEFAVDANRSNGQDLLQQTRQRFIDDPNRQSIALLRNSEAATLDTGTYKEPVWVSRVTLEQR